MKDKKGYLEGVKTPFYKDVKLDIRAGMPFNKPSYKIKTVGHEVIRQYFDSPELDCQVGRQRIKRIIL